MLTARVWNPRIIPCYCSRGCELAESHDLGNSRSRGRLLGDPRSLGGRLPEARGYWVAVASPHVDECDDASLMKMTVKL